MNVTSPLSSVVLAACCIAPWSSRAQQVVQAPKTEVIAAVHAIDAIEPWGRLWSTQTMRGQK
jgi:hypothetical protein